MKKRTRLASLLLVLNLTPAQAVRSTIAGLPTLAYLGAFWNYLPVGGLSLYEYRPEARVRVYDDSWKWRDEDKGRYRWRDSGPGCGYYRRCLDWLLGHDKPGAGNHTGFFLSHLSAQQTRDRELWPKVFFYPDLVARMTAVYKSAVKELKLESAPAIEHERLATCILSIGHSHSDKHRLLDRSVCLYIRAHSSN